MGLIPGRKSNIGLLVLCAMCLVWSFSASAGQKIRMYEMNKKQQQRKIFIGGAVEEAGCHDLLWGKDIYRFAQFGYAWCSLYTRKGCAADSIATAFWEEGKYHKYNIDGSKPQEKLYPGGKWMVKSSDAAIKSWHCEAK